MKTAGQAAYEGYCEAAAIVEWLVSGAPLSEWAELKQEIRDAWHMAAEAAIAFTPMDAATGVCTAREALALPQAVMSYEDVATIGALVGQINDCIRRDFRRATLGVPIPAHLLNPRLMSEVGRLYVRGGWKAVWQVQKEKSTLAGPGVEDRVVGYVLLLEPRDDVWAAAVA